MKSVTKQLKQCKKTNLKLPENLCKILNEKTRCRTKNKQGKQLFEQPALLVLFVVIYSLINRSYILAKN